MADSPAAGGRTSSDSSAARSKSPDVTTVGPADIAVQGPAHPALTRPRVTPLDPFANHTPWTFYEVLKFILAGLVLLPLRILALMIMLPIGWFAALCGSACLNRNQDFATAKFGCFRRCCKRPIGWGSRAITFSWGYWWINFTRRAPKAPKPMPAVIVSNHTSLADAFVLFPYYLSSFVAKQAVMNLPIIDRAAITVQTILVDRADGASRQRVLNLLQDRSKNPEFPPTLIFPEGTTSNGKCLMQFKKGAFSPGVPVLPVVVRYPHRFYNVCDTGHHGGSISMLWAMFQFINFVQVEELPPYFPSPEEVADADLYAENVRKIMAAALKVPVTQHSFDDFRLHHHARSAHVPQTFEVSEVTAHMGWTVQDLISILKLYKAQDTDHDGHLTVAQSLSLLRTGGNNGSAAAGGDDTATRALAAAVECAKSHIPVSSAWTTEAPRVDLGAVPVVDFITHCQAAALMRAAQQGLIGPAADEWYRTHPIPSPPPCEASAPVNAHV